MRCVCQCHSRPTIRGNKKRENDTTRQDTRKREREQGTVHVIESPFFQETLLQEADHKGRQPQCSLQTKGNQTIWPWRNKGTRISFEHAYQCICPCTHFPNKVVIRPFYCPSNAGLLGHKDKTCKADRVFPRGKKERATSTSVCSRSSVWARRRLGAFPCTSVPGRDLGWRRGAWRPYGL